MADMKTLTINGTTYNVVDETARDSVQNANDKIEKFDVYNILRKSASIAKTQTSTLRQSSGFLKGLSISEI